MVIGAANTAAPSQYTSIPAMAYLRACRPKALCDLIMGSACPGIRRCDGNGKTIGLPKGIVGTNPSQLWFTIARAAKIDATEIHHKCGYCATIFQSDSRPVGVSS